MYLCSVTNTAVYDYDDSIQDAGRFVQVLQSGDFRRYALRLHCQYVKARRGLRVLCRQPLEGRERGEEDYPRNQHQPGLHEP